MYVPIPFRQQRTHDPQYVTVIHKEPQMVYGGRGSFVRGPIQCVSTKQMPISLRHRGSFNPVTNLTCTTNTQPFSINTFRFRMQKECWHRTCQHSLFLTLCLQIIFLCLHKLQALSAIPMIPGWQLPNKPKVQ